MRLNEGEGQERAMPQHLTLREDFLFSFLAA